MLSGGGAKGAFQAGALRYMDEVVRARYPDFQFSVVSGISVGCLNGVMVAQQKLPELLQIWNRMSNAAVYTGRLRLPSALYHLALRSKRAVLGYKPLQELIGRHVSLADTLASGIHFTLGVVSLTDGCYYPCQAGDFTDEQQFRNAILASAAMPVLWEPVSEIRTKQGTITQAVDGGVRNNSPLGDVLDQEPDEVVILNCSPFTDGENSLEPAPEAGRNVFTIAKRALLDIALNEIFITDLREYLTLNHLVKQAAGQGVQLKNRKGRLLKAYKTVLISPLEPLGDLLDFSQPAVQRRLQLGYEAARQAFAAYQPQLAGAPLYSSQQLA
ncbi:patatin-like phospholipase family protein [Cesiribacter andamanensis]|uniref:Patatin-like phospholipase n=1 Tax=Cesiribacter andamanensis AMV16 TaxID=1279009 RepID=M7NAQ4_9BACT|nr:patatin-like phospholipase family protein [Cesiribacter andamanensis]EMR04337.1 Patatin-like phospholipase [Cesiribacter andamanensis AMV16]